MFIPGGYYMMYAVIHHRVIQLLPEVIIEKEYPLYEYLCDISETKDM